MKEITDLIPCTCGKIPKIVKGVDKKFFVACYHPFCKDRLATGNRDKKQEAIADWNGKIVTSSFLIDKPTYAMKGN